MLRLSILSRGCWLHMKSLLTRCDSCISHQIPVFLVNAKLVVIKLSVTDSLAVSYEHVSTFCPEFAAQFSRVGVQLDTLIALCHQKWSKGLRTLLLFLHWFLHVLGPSWCTNSHKLEISVSHCYRIQWLSVWHCLCLFPLEKSKCIFVQWNLITKTCY